MRSPARLSTSSILLRQNRSPIQQIQRPPKTVNWQPKHRQNFKMAEAGGIDRKAEERMEFNTSKEVTVHPTFESMSLKGKAQSSIARMSFGNER